VIKEEKEKVRILPKILSKDLLKGGLRQNWEAYFYRCFGRMEAAFIEVRGVLGTATVLKRRVQQVDKNIALLGKALKDGDTATMQKHLTRLGVEMYSIRHSLRDICTGASKARDVLNESVRLDSYWNDTEAEEIE
jgi:hypothetical protein